MIDASLSGGCPPEFVVRRPVVSPPPPTNLPSKRWRDLILRVWRVDPLRCPSSLGGDFDSSFILHHFRQASSGPVCPGIALLLAHCLAARPLPPAYGFGDGAKPPENRQTLPVAALHQFWQDGAGMNEGEKQFSFTRATTSTSGRAKIHIPISSALALDPTHQFVNLKYVFRDPFMSYKQCKFIVLAFRSTGRHIRTG